MGKSTNFSIALNMLGEGWYPSNDASDSAGIIADCLRSDTALTEGERDEFVNGLPGELQRPVRDRLPDARTNAGGLGHLVNVCQKKRERDEQGADPDVGGARGGTISRALSALRRAGSPLLGAVGYDAMAQRVAVRDPGALPWHHEGAAWGARDEPHALQHMQDVIPGGRCSVQTCENVVRLIADENVFNPAADLFDSLEWDGVDRAPFVFEHFLGVAPSDYERAVSRLFLREVVARAYYPGTQADVTPVLVSNVEGVGKTTLCRLLALEPRYYVALKSLGGLDPTKTAGECIRGRLVCELEEAQALRGRGMTPDKANSWLTSTTDSYRPAYGRDAEDFPRTCCTIVTCNNTDWLDSIGQARRFAPVRCGEAGLPLPLRDRDGGTMGQAREWIRQAYAQTVQELRAYKDAHGGSLPSLVLPASVRPQAEQERDRARGSDETVDAVLDYLRECREGNADGYRVSVLSVMCHVLGYDYSEGLHDRETQARVKAILNRRAAGWKPVGRKHVSVAGVDRTQQCWEFSAPEESQEK